MAETKGGPDALAETRVADSKDDSRVSSDTLEASSPAVGGDTMADMLGSLAGLLEAVAHTPDVAPPISLEPGTIIDGKYRVEAEIGIGGMGVVYRARDLHLSRDIALKVHGRLSHADSYHRLSREATAMAQLSHPNVVTVHSVGDIDGQLFIAMELVDGGTMSSWMRAPDRDWRTVLDLFLRAGEGLAAAHDIGLVHRDFKPDNILISKDEQVRVADFGLARAVEAGAAGATDTPSLSDSTEAFHDKLTQTGAFLGTPAYMAPEQFDQVEVDARADQFAFCVALYEGLYGERPFSAVRISELQRQIAAGAVREPPENTTVPRWLRAILLRGLSADPAERFSSMRALLSMLRSDPTVRRKRMLVGAGAVTVVVAGLTAALFIGRSQAVSTGPACTAGPERIQRVWNEQRLAAVRQSFTPIGGEYAGQALERIDAMLGEYRNQWSAIWVQSCEAAADGEMSPELLDRSMVCLDRALGSLDALVDIFERADRTVVGRSVRAIGELPSVALCADADAMLAQVAPPSDPELEAAVVALRARIDAAHAHYGAGTFATGYSEAKQIVADARGVDYPPALSEALLLAGKLAVEVGDTDAARAFLDEAFFTARTAGYDQLAVASSSFLVYAEGYANLNYQLGDNWNRHAQAEIAHLAEPERSRAEVELLAHAAAMYDRNGKIDEAAEALIRAKNLVNEIYGPDSLRMARLLANQTAVLHVQGKLSEAYDAGMRAIGLFEQVYGDWNPALGIVLGNVGLVATDRGLHDEAIELQRRALELAAAHQGADSIDAGYAHLNLGVAIHNAGRYADAIEEYDRALAIVKQRLGADHPDVGLVLNSLGVAYEGLQRYDEAIVHVQGAIDLMQPGSTELPGTIGNLAGLYMRANRPLEARARLLEALEMADQVAPDSVSTMLILIDLGKVHVTLGEPTAAFPYLDRADRIADASGVGAERLALARFTRAQALWDSNRDRAGALALARAAFAGLDGTEPELAQNLEAWLAEHGAQQP